MVSLLFVFTAYCSAAQKDETGKAVYRQISKPQGFTLSDTLAKQTNMPVENIKIPLGEFLYTAYYRNGLSRTEIRFAPAPGIRPKNESVGYLFSRTTDSAFFFYENGSLVSSYVFRLPVLTKTAQAKTIESYPCIAYQYKEGNVAKAVVWFCKKLPAWVGPGIYYKDLGGIVRIDYLRPQDSWSLQLVSSEKTNEEIDFKMELPKPKGKSRVHYFLRKD